MNIPPGGHVDVEVRFRARDWRDLDEDQRYEVVLGLARKMLARYEEGAKEHGEYCTDDPLEQLETELLDGLFYCEMARRERASLGPDAKPNGKGTEPVASLGRWFRSVLGGGS